MFPDFITVPLLLHYGILHRIASQYFDGEEPHEAMCTLALSG